MERDISTLRRQVGSLTFANPIVFGGGTCKTLDDALGACKSDVGGIEIGTITRRMRPGNEGPDTFYAFERKGVLIATLNSLGMPNPGRGAWSTWASEALHCTHASEKKIGVNIAGDTAEEIVDMVLWGQELGFDWVTINGGCPNKFHDGKPLGTLTFDQLGVEELLTQLEYNVPRGKGEVWWKPSPFTDTVSALPASARMIAQSHVITGYVANNTVPHCFSWNKDGAQAISVGDGRAGMGGPAVKPISMGHLRTVHDILPGRMARIGSGGACYGEDVADYLRQKADLVQMTSWVWYNNMNYGVANQTLAELMEVPDLEAIL